MGLTFARHSTPSSVSLTHSSSPSFASRFFIKISFIHLSMIASACFSTLSLARIINFDRLPSRLTNDLSPKVKEGTIRYHQFASPWGLHQQDLQHRDSVFAY